jgi:hypothetical protein
MRAANDSLRRTTATIKAIFLKETNPQLCTARYCIPTRQNPFKLCVFSLVTPLTLLY